MVVHPDAGALAEAAAARLLIRLADVQAVRSPAHVVLTGGTVGIAALAAAARSPLLDTVDWSDVHVWWGDERFLPDGHPERNETQARAALLGALGGRLLPERVHAVPAAGTPGIGTAEDAAAAYAAELRRAADPGRDVPVFDVLLLGVGPDAHVASLFPGHPALSVTGSATVAVHDSPKPPPDRTSLTLEAICTAREVWLVAAGAGKAAAVARALTAADPGQVPAAAALGRDLTLWLLDAAAAGQGLSVPGATGAPRAPR